MTTVATRESYLSLSHGKTRFLEAGHGDPVILLHGVGFTAGAESWLLNIEPLATRLHVFALDCLGWGLGDRLNTPYSFAYLVDHVREVQDALGLKKSHIAGHSMGGWLASLLAYESPNRVDKLVLVASGGTARRQLQSMVQFKPPTREEIHAQLEQRFHGAVDVEPLEEQDVRKTQNAEWVEAYTKIMAHMSDPLTRIRYNTLRRLPHITAPTLIVWGRDDKVNPLSMGEETQRLIPNSRLLVFDNCGHGVPTEEPDKFNRAILEFLA